MQIPDNKWLGRLQKATQVNGPASTNVKVDEKLVKAGDDLYVTANKLMAEAGGSPAEAAERLWSARGQDGVPGLAERIVAGGSDDAALSAIKSSSMDDLGALIDQLAVRMLVKDGHEEELHRLLTLKTVVDAGADIIPAYNSVVRSTLAHQRTAEMVDPKLDKAFQGIKQRVDLAYAKAVGGAATESVRESAVKASNALWGLGGRAFKAMKDRATGTSTVASSVKAAVNDLKATMATLLPQNVLDKLEQAKDGAATLIDAIGDIQNVKDDREIAARFTAALPAVAETLDKSADAIAVGMLKETALLVTGASGHEMVYVRETGELHINELEGVGGRLGIGGTMRAFTRNAYGDVANTDATRRSGYELGLVCAHLGVYGGNTEGAPRGWHSTFSLGFNASIPLLSDQSIFDVKETRTRTVKLLPQEVERIEAHLDGVSKSSKSWHKTMREKTGAAPREP